MGVWEDLTGQTSRDNAIKAQSEGTDKANKYLESMFYQGREDLNPYLGLGTSAVAGLDRGMTGGDLTRGFTMADFNKDPGYQFRMKEGMNAIQGSAAARGSLNSGATMKALSRYGQDFASNEYQNAYNRFSQDRDQRFSKFSHLAGMGQNATGQALGVNHNYGNQVAANFTGLGNAQAAAHINQYNTMADLAGQGAQAGAMVATGGTSGAVATSDRRLKTNIESVSKEDIKELRSTIKPYIYNYVSDKYGKGDWVGVMAQDLEKSKLGKTAVFENEEGHKMVDMTKLTFLMFALMAEGAA